MKAALLVRRHEVLPKTTADDGVWKLPDGDAFYAYKLRENTTTTLKPDEVHAVRVGAHIPMSSPQRKTMFGFFASCAKELAIETVKATTISAAVVRFVSISMHLDENRTRRS